MKPIIATTSGLAVTIAFAASAFAIDKPEAEATVTETQTVRTIDADGQVGEITVFSVDRTDRNSAVLGAFAQQQTDAYIVQDTDGDLYINHLVPIEELPDPTLDVETVDTYMFEYGGKVYTNKIVDER